MPIVITVKNGGFGLKDGGVDGQGHVSGDKVVRQIEGLGLPASNMSFQEIYGLINRETYEKLPKCIKEFTLISLDIN